MHNTQPFTQTYFCMICFPVCNLKNGRSKVQKKASLRNKSNFLKEQIQKLQVKINRYLVNTSFIWSHLAFCIQILKKKNIYYHF